MQTDLKSLSVSGLLKHLHDSIVSFVKTIDNTTGRNNSISEEEIGAIRDHLKQRLSSNKEALENEKLLKLIDLFEMDKKVLEFIKGDAKEWLDLIETLKDSLAARGALNEQEKAELEEITRKLDRLASTLRKEGT